MEQNAGADSSQLVSLDTANKLNTEAANSQKESEPEQLPNPKPSTNFLSRLVAKPVAEKKGGETNAPQASVGGYIF